MILWVLLHAPHIYTAGILEVVPMAFPSDHAPASLCLVACHELWLLPDNATPQLHACLRPQAGVHQGCAAQWAEHPGPTGPSHSLRTELSTWDGSLSAPSACRLASTAASAIAAHSVHACKSFRNVTRKSWPMCGSAHSKQQEQTQNIAPLQLQAKLHHSTPHM
jgi:hypothetical protein